jgi:hypothetical protein
MDAAIQEPDLIYVHIITMMHDNLQNIRNLARTMSGVNVAVIFNGVDVVTDNLWQTRRTPYRMGCAEARNFAVNYFQYTDDDSIHVFIDDDCYVSATDWLHKLIEPIKSDTADIAGVQGGFITRDYLTVATSSPAPHYVGGGRMVVRGAIFNRGLRFDEDFHPNYWEDADFCVRAQLYGFRVRAVGPIGLEHDVVHIKSSETKRWRQATYAREVFKHKWSIGMLEALLDEF